ncbi:hypothetical protein [Agaribacterium sp. ZY112]|uniref:hypothetical protein n=1 Tax=Agaribacterium sp. ZY112 TaxID=3233574 RepID=UPI0035242ECA
MKTFNLRFKLKEDTVIVENDGFSVWAYLLNRDETGIEKDTFICSPISPDSVLDRKYIEEGNPPKITEEYATESAKIDDISRKDIYVKTTGEGDFCILVKREAFAAIYKDEERGYSKAILKSGGFGNPWCSNLYEKTFEPKS